MSLEDRLASLTGQRLSSQKIRVLRERLLLPEDLARLFQDHPFAGTRLTLSEEDDRSRLGAEMQVMDDAQMLSEAFDVYPGILAVPLGYVPVGMCLLGSGDYYFVRVSDGAVVRIPHDAVVDDELDEAQFEEVTASLDELLTKADVE